MSGFNMFFRDNLSHNPGQWCNSMTGKQTIQFGKKLLGHMIDIKHIHCRYIQTKSQNTQHRVTHICFTEFQNQLQLIKDHVNKTNIYINTNL